jgi:hypothetical protein
MSERLSPGSPDPSPEPELSVDELDEVIGGARFVLFDASGTPVPAQASVGDVGCHEIGHWMGLL